MSAAGAVPPNGTVTEGRDKHTGPPDLAGVPDIEGSGGQPGEVLAAAESLLSALATLNPERIGGPDAAQIARLLARVAKAASYAEASLAARAVAAEAHRTAGYVSAPDFVAAQGGLSLSEARGRLSLMGALEAMPGTKEALKTGELSLSQAADLAKAEAACPGAGEALVPLARSASREALKDQAAKVLARSMSAETLAARRQAARRFSSWTDELGMLWLKAALPPEVGQAVVARVEALTQKRRRQARSDGEELESFPALAADALVSLLLGTGPITPVRSEVVFVVSYDAYRRGHVHPGEPCHLVGCGAVPLSTVAATVPDAFIKGLVVKGKDILKLAHFGRRLSAELKSALLLGPGPDFPGATCAAPGCGRRYGLEIDHRVPLSEQGPTSYANLQPLCKAHHWRKTESDRASAKVPWPNRRSTPAKNGGGTESPKTAGHPTAGADTNTGHHLGTADALRGDSGAGPPACDERAAGLGRQLTFGQESSAGATDERGNFHSGPVTQSRRGALQGAPPSRRQPPGDQPAPQTG